MNGPWRVLHVLDHSLPLHSGYSFRTLAILREQRRLGWETLHLTGPRQGPGEGCQETVQEWTFYRTPAREPALPLWREWHWVRALGRRLEQVARAQRPDIIHAHSPALNALAALQAGRRLGLPVVYEVRAFWEDAAVDHGTARAGGPRYRATRALETYVLRRAHAVTTICEGLRADIVQRGIPAARVTVIPNAVDAAQFAPAQEVEVAALRAQLDIAPGAPVLAFAGSFYAYEGLDILLRAFARLRAAQPEAVLVLVGGGPQEAALRALAAELGVERAVRFTGRVPNRDVAAYYRLATAMVYPRRAMRLTELVTPLKPLEAMAHNCLVVASDVGGHRELIREGDNGLLCAPDDPEALAARLAHVLAMPAAHWDVLRARGRSFVEQERSWRASVARYPAVYAAAHEAAHG